jgi:hypothetical protein
MGVVASYTDELITVYLVPQPIQSRPVAYLGPGWGELEGQETARWRWMGETAQVTLLNPTDGPRSVELRLSLESYAHERPLTLRLNDGAPATLLVSRARMERTLRLLLPPGEHVLYLQAPAERVPGRDGQDISIAFLSIEIE